MSTRSQSEIWRVLDKQGKSLLIRPILTSDTAKLTQFFSSLSAKSRALFQPHPFTRQFAHKMARDAFATHHLRLVALNTEEKGEIVGYAFVSRPPFFSQYGYFGIGVADAHQKKGIGSALMKILFEYAKKQGVQKIYLNVFSSNTKAQAAYTSLGFITTSSPTFLSKIFTMFELWYNGELGNLFKKSVSGSHSTNTPVWMVKEL